MPFYKLLKKVDKFQWTTEAQEARGTEEVLDHPASTQATALSYAWLAGRRSAPVYLIHDSRDKHSISSRAGGGRTRIPGAASSLFH
jgi:hypothetical protein